MKRLLLLIIIPFALILANNGVIVTQSTFDKVSLSISSPSLTVSSQELDGRLFSELAIPDGCMSTEIGAPLLPVIREFVEIPFGAEVDIRADVIKSELVYPQYQVIPLQHSIPKSGPKPDFVMNEEIYNQNQFATNWSIDNGRWSMDRERARINMIGEIRGHRLALVEIFPVAYNSKENIVEYASEIKVNLSIHGANLLLTEQMRNNYYSKPYDMMLRDLVKNYDPYVLTPPPDLPIGYLIIVPDAWVNNVQPLVQWRTRKGYTVFVRTVSQAGGSSSTAIRNYIMQAYNTWSIRPTFVLLVGDVDNIGYFTGQGTGNPPTDLNFSMMTDTDYLPDIDVSRASVANSAQLDSLITKTIRYEKNQWMNGTDWAKKALFVASADGSYHGVAEGTHRYCLALVRRYGVIADSIFTYYTSNAAAMVTTRVNEGRAWLTFSGHGGETGWADPGISYPTSTVHGLTNVDKVPLVGSYCCLSGNYTYSSECFSESWIRSGYRGAIANYASSVTSYWAEDDTLQRRVFDYAFDSNYVWAMGMLNKAKIRYITQMGNIGMTRRYFEMYNMMGDGAIDIYWDVPAAINVTYPAAIPLGTYQIPITVTKNGQPVKNALVCAMAKSDTSIRNVGYTNVSGQVQLQITTTAPDSIYITVTGHNLAPHLGAAQAIPSAGAYVMYMRHTILDPAPGGNNNGIVNPGEAVEMRVWLKNFGNSTANNVRVWLRTTDPNITITDSFKNYGNIGANDSGYSADGFNFAVSPNCGNGYNLNFSLVIKDLQDSTWRSSLSIPVAQCILQHISTTVNDIPPGGNNNGIINRGETVNLIATIKNTGGATASNITSVLLSTTPGILILDANGSFGSIDPNNSGSNQANPFTIKADSSVIAGTMAYFNYIVFSGVYVETLQFSLPIEIYLANLEDNNGNYVPAPATGGWEWGVPTSGPNNAHSGTKVWATVLGGNYANSANWTLTTPELTATGNNPTLTFWHWYSFEGTSTLYDGGNVKISTNNGQTWTVVTPVGEYTGTAYSSTPGVGGQQIFGGSNQTWTEVTFNNLPVNAGQRFLLRWHFGSDGSVNTYDGWYIDDITGIGFAVMPPPNNDVGIDAILSPGSYHFPNTPMTPAVKIKNFGALAQTNCPVVCSIVGPNSVLRYTNTQTVNISSGDTVRVNFLNWIPTINEVCTVKVRTNLIGDEMPGNDRQTQVTTISQTSQIQIDSATTNARVEPFDRYYNYNTHEVLYLQSEIGVAGSITSLGYYKDNGSNIDAITPVTIYMKHTTDVTLPSGTYSLTGYFQVYSGAFPNNATSGWMEIQLTTPFQYNNTSNLQILIIKGNQAYISSGYPYWRYTTKSVYLTRGARSDASQPTSLTQTFNRPNIRFMITSNPGVEQNNLSTLPLITALYAPKPNPVINGIAHISYSIAEPSKVALKIYDASGRIVRTLVNTQVEQGIYNLTWNGKDDNNRAVAEGIYFYTLETPNQKFTKKMVYTR